MLMLLTVTSALLTCIITMVTLTKRAITLKGHWRFEKINSVQTMLMLLTLTATLALCIITKVTLRQIEIIINEHWKFEKNYWVQTMLVSPTQRQTWLIVRRRR
jgi:hypothetical protein